jgi:hypothetical protein
MAKHSRLPEHQHRQPCGVRIAVRFGKAVEFDARASTGSLFAIGALVSGALLCSATIVLAARRNGGPASPKLLDSGH